MGKIKKILENELVGGTQSTDIYPITSTKAIYDENNVRLDDILKPATKESAGLMSPEDKNNIELVQTEVAGKVDKASVVQESGDSEELVMSQKAVSTKLSTLKKKVDDIPATIPKVVSMSESAYDDLETKEPDTYYMLTEE